MRQVKRSAPVRGFTLLEVLIALAVFAIAAAAMISGITDSVAAQSHLERKTLASWVAQNQLALVRLQDAWPDLGEVSGEEEMAGRSWFWRRHTQATSDERLRRVDVEVRAAVDDDTALIRLSAFVNATPAKSNPSSPAVRSMRPDKPALPPPRGENDPPQPPGNTPPDDQDNRIKDTR